MSRKEFLEASGNFSIYGVVFEVSTHHEDSDSYRVFKGDTQK